MTEEERKRARLEGFSDAAVAIVMIGAVLWMLWHLVRG
jgi:uncharacterized membrane protein